MNIRMTSDERRCAELLSAVIAATGGIAPPMPRPPRKRNAASIVAEVANAQPSVKMPVTHKASTSMGRRPKRSASGPTISEPSTVPTNPAPNMRTNDA
jgi:hypothetical protein